MTKDYRIDKLKYLRAVQHCCDKVRLQNSVVLWQCKCSRWCIGCEDIRASLGFGTISSCLTVEWYRNIKGHSFIQDQSLLVVNPN